MTVSPLPVATSLLTFVFLACYPLHIFSFFDGAPSHHHGHEQVEIDTTIAHLHDMSEVASVASLILVVCAIWFVLLSVCDGDRVYTWVCVRERGLLFRPPPSFITWLATHTLSPP